MSHKVIRDSTTVSVTMFVDSSGGILDSHVDSLISIPEVLLSG
jgi:hypothetical protein